VRETLDGIGRRSEANPYRTENMFRELHYSPKKFSVRRKTRFHTVSTENFIMFSEREPPHRELHFAVILVIRNHFSHCTLIVRTFCYPTFSTGRARSPPPPPIRNSRHSRRGFPDCLTIHHHHPGWERLEDLEDILPFFLYC